MTSIDKWLKTPDGRAAMAAIRAGEAHNTIAWRYGVARTFLRDARVHAKVIPDVMAQAIQAWQAGMLVPEILTKFGITSTSLYRAMDLLGIKRGRLKPRPQRWCAWCGEDIPAERSSRVVACTPECIRELRKDKRRRNGEATACPACGTEVLRYGYPHRNEINGGYCSVACARGSADDTLRRDLNQVERYFCQGWTVNQVAYELGMNPHYVRRLRRKLEITERIKPSPMARNSKRWMASHATN